MIYSTSSGSGTQHVVLVHGLTCDHTDWNIQVDTLSSEAHCTCVDLRGHGQSADLDGPYDIDALARDVIELCIEKNIDSAVFVGHSMGTRVIASVAQQAPSMMAKQAKQRNSAQIKALVNALVFVDGSKQANDNPAAVLEALQAQFSEANSARRFIEDLFVPMFTANSDASRRDLIVERAMNTPPTIFQSLISGMLKWDAGSMQTTLKNLQQPMYVVQSTTVNEQRERTSLSPNQSTPYLS